MRRARAVPDELDVAGVRVHLLRETGALELIERLHDAGSPAGLVTYVNPHTVNLAARDPAYAACLARADIRLADGFGLRFAARRQRVHVPAILNGSDFNLEVLRLATARQWPVFLLGGRPGVPELAARRLTERLPGLRVVGVQHGYLSPADAGAVCDIVRRSGASTLMVALGQPLQERWLERHLDSTGVRLGLAVGGFLDFSAGVVARAPAWMNRAGLEWSFRLAHEPRRLAYRYLVGNPLYLWRTLRPSGALPAPPIAAGEALEA